MSVKGPVSPLSSGAESLEPLDSRELQQSVKGGQIASDIVALENAVGTPETQDPTLQTLRQIAAGSDFSTKEKTEAAIRESARLMIKARIQDKFRDQETVTEMVDELSEFVTGDPFMHNKLLKILQKLKNK